MDELSSSLSAHTPPILAAKINADIHHGNISIKSENLSSQHDPSVTNTTINNQQQNSPNNQRELQIEKTSKTNKQTNRNELNQNVNVIKSSSTDLNTEAKTELFNKLILSQSQQMIVTTPLNENNTKNKSENLYRANSLNAHSSKKNPSISNNTKTLIGNKNNLTTANPAGSKTTSSNNSSIATNPTTIINNNNSLNQISLFDLKNSPVVFSKFRNRWYTNEEVAAILTNFSSHPEWQTEELQLRPKSGAVLLYSREKVRYRQDGYCWKKRKNGRTTREDHMKLKVQGIECIYGCYVHSAILPTFHRRCYWLLQNPDIVLVHYLNQPPDDQNKMMITFDPTTLEADTRRSWTNEEIIEEIGSVFGGISQIQHTLNLNFSEQSALVIQASQQILSSTNQNNNIKTNQSTSLDDSEKMIESSSQSNNTVNSSSTPSSVANNNNNDDNNDNNNNSNQIDMAIIDNRQHPTVNNEPGRESENNTIIINQEQEDEDELMTSFSCGSVREDEKRYMENCCLESTNQQNETGTTQMTFDIVNEYSAENNTNSDDQNDLAFVVEGYTSSNNDNLVLENNNVSIGGGHNDNSKQQMEQNPCSPVTQIYNKIVDDIETYALPLEPDQFNRHHHHHHHHNHNHHLQDHHNDLSISSLPMQTMDISNDTISCNQATTSQLHHQQSQQLICASLNEHRISQTNERILNAADNSSNQQPIGKQFTSSCETGAIKDLATCSMDLTGCDLFNDERNDHHHVENNQDLMINMQTSVGEQENSNRSDIGNNVVETLSNVDDLRDLMMTNNVVDNSSLLVDTNSFDIFSFKPLDCDTQQTIQQLEIKSSTSDTDALARLSPLLIGCVPRCNSTGNAMHPAHLNSNYHHSQQHQHFSSNFLSSAETAPNGNLGNNNFCDFQSSIHNEQTNSLRSSSTNQSHSTSCSSNSLPRSGGATVGNCDNLMQQYNNSSSFSPSLMKIPLQQRQNSEQQEPCNSVLNSLLPKALSLDGGDLSITNRDNGRNSNHLHYRRHRLSTSPIISYENLGDRQHLDSMTSGLESQSSSLLNQQFISSYERVNSTSSKLEPTTAKHLTKVSGDSRGYSDLYSITSSSDNRLSFNNNTKTSSLLTILDYVPNWCNITGGAKVLIVGNWNSLLVDQNNNLPFANMDRKKIDDIIGFSVMFDDLLVPATLIMDNVLRCYAPSHEQGFITLKVLYMDCIVSEQVLFEMRPSCSSSQSNIQIPGTTYSSTSDQVTYSQARHVSDRDSFGESMVSDKTNSNIVSGQTTGQNHQNLFSDTISLPGTSYNETSIRKSSKVLTLAENIISAMHKKNNFRTHLSNSRLVNSLDIETLDHYRSGHHFRHLSQRSSQQCPNSFRANQRSLTNSRSLSRESEPCTNSYAMNYGLGLETDPYWHKNPTDIVWFESQQQPLTIQTDQHAPKYQAPSSSGSTSSGYQSISGSSTQQTNQQPVQSIFTPHFAQRPKNLLLTNSYNININQQHQQQPPYEMQNLTETSSSGLGSIVSSLSPSPTSLHSPTSVCCVNSLFKQEQGRQSPCSCERQSTGTPTSADFCEYFQASAKTEETFASLTLNVKEQQELYEAAKIIQKAYRTYRGRKRQASELMVDTSAMYTETNPPTCDYQAQMSSQTPTSVHKNQSQSDAGIQATSRAINRLQQQAQQIQLQTCPQQQQQHQQQQQNPSANFIKCYRDKEMQAATIIQAYYRRYRQYVHYKIQQSNKQTKANLNASQQQQQITKCTHRLIVEPIPVVIGKATTSHVDRKRFKTAVLCSNTTINCNQQITGNSVA